MASDLKNEIKSYIVRTGCTMQEVVDLLADEHGWSDSGQAAVCQGDRWQQEEADRMAGCLLEAHGEEVSQFGAWRECQ